MNILDMGLGYLGNRGGLGSDMARNTPSGLEAIRECENPITAYYSAKEELAQRERDLAYLQGRIDEAKHRVERLRPLALEAMRREVDDAAKSA